MQILREGWLQMRLPWEPHGHTRVDGVSSRLSMASQGVDGLDFCSLLCKNRRVPVIDFHTHIFPPHVIAKRHVYLQRDRWFGRLYANPQARMATADQLIHSMDAAGIDAAVAFGFAWADQGLNREANDYVLESMARWPDRLLGFAEVNPAAKGATAEIERCLQHGMRGLGELMPDGQGYTLDSPQLDEVVEQMAQWKRPVLVHCGEPVGHVYPGKSSCTLDPFYRLALRHPDVTFIAAHWGGGLFFYELMPEVRQALHNVYYDSAASLLLYADPVFSLAAQIIPHKALFATDYPLISHERFLHHVRDAGLSTKHVDAILGGNAARLLKMGGKAKHEVNTGLCGD
jgi:predicted TIM-barrel fold metal-dependent hydrolase